MPAFDYYVLSLSWAPAFCDNPSNAAANPKECGPGTHVRFVVHGLWPQAIDGNSPESCGKTKPAPKPVVNMALPFMLSSALIQHEWATHGACSGLTPAEYFTRLVEARVNIQLPVQITAIDEVTAQTPEQIEAEFAGANPEFPRRSFRTGCIKGVFEEIRACFDRDLKARECTASVLECADPSVKILPPR